MASSYKTKKKKMNSVQERQESWENWLERTQREQVLINSRLETTQKKFQSLAEQENKLLTSRLLQYLVIKILSLSNFGVLSINGFLI